MNVHAVKHDLFSLQTCTKLNMICLVLFVPCIIRRIRRDQQYALISPLLYSIYWFQHVSAVACHHQGAY
jgi:hypothetical protein